MNRKTFSPGPTYVSEPRPILQRRGRRRACENTGSVVQRAPTLATLGTHPPSELRTQGGLHQLQLSRSPWIQHGIWKTDEQRSTARAPITAAPGTQPWRRCRGPTAPCLCTTSRGRRGGAGWAAEPAAPCRRPTFPRRSLASRGRRLRPSVPVPRRPPRRRPPRRVTEKRLEPCRCPLARRRPTQASRSSRHHGPMTVPRGIGRPTQAASSPVCVGRLRPPRPLRRPQKLRLCPDPFALRASFHGDSARN